ncbi:hypothetical protein NDU88_002850 [Pleurodeles waltl]|uniref:Nuclease HARBI1 n=1 Tax=Pleurodeles waltl TaxID=8319 RepID=A0AAV7WQP7_PLEWA|nr:hypothetical protein NDU88_002850 [Pleurodeles waltl]
MYRPQNCNSPIRHLFRGGFTANKNTAETGLGRENAHLYTTHEEPGCHGTRAPDSSSLYLPAPLPGARTLAAKTTGAGGGGVLFSGAGGGGVLGSGAGGGGVLGNCAGGGGVLGSGAGGGGVLGSGAGGGGVLGSGAGGGGVLGSGAGGGGVLGSSAGDGLVHRSGFPRLAGFTVPLPHLGWWQRPLWQVRRWRHPPVYRPLVDLSTMEERHVIITYRLDRTTILELYAKLEPDLMSAIRHPTGIPPQVQVLSVLHFLAIGSFQTTVAMASGMSQPMFSNLLSRVLSALLKHMRSYIVFPQVENLPTVKVDFYAMRHIPNIIGAIDGTHVALVSPCGSEQVYRNRKSYHSMNV